MRSRTWRGASRPASRFPERRDAAREGSGEATVNFLQGLIPAGTESAMAADVRYQVMNSVPEN